jgi:hypothetical protein
MKKLANMTEKFRRNMECYGINPYPAKVENIVSSHNASRWQMGSNSPFKGLIRNLETEKINISV